MSKCAAAAIAGLALCLVPSVALGAPRYKKGTAAQVEVRRHVKRGKAVAPDPRGEAPRLSAAAFRAAAVQAKVGQLTGAALEVLKRLIRATPRGRP